MNGLQDSPRAKRDATISALRANLVAFAIAVPLAALQGFIFIALFGMGVASAAWTTALLSLVIGGMILHEMLHVWGFRLFGRVPDTAVRLGFNWRAFAPFAHVSVPVTAAAYRQAALLPGVVLGVLPAAAGMAVGSGLVVAFAVIMQVAALGDVLIVWQLRDVGPDEYVSDHPSRIGCEIVRGPKG